VVERKIEIGVAKDEIAHVVIVIFQILRILPEKANEMMDVAKIISNKTRKSLRFFLICTNIGM